jgi:hypothetical protein
MNVFEQIMAPFIFIIEQILQFSYELTGNYGVSIILLSFAISLLLLPVFIYIEKSKKKYEDDLLKHFKGDIVFDLIFLGVGSDGHTGSIFEKNQVDSPENVIVTSSRRHPYMRVSLGMNVINKARRKIFLLGPEKIPIIDSTIFKDLPVSKVVDPEFLSYLK